MQKGKIKEYGIWCFLSVLLIFIHIYRIGELPYGINCDEMGMGYDAWCLAHFGTDRYQNSFPVYLINFSGGQSALYAYLCAPLVYLFGMNAVVFRVPIAVCGLLTCYFGLKIVELLFGKQSKMLAMFLYIVFPVFTMLFRIGLDCNLMLGAVTIFIYALMKAINEQELKKFLIAGVIGGVVLYTYVLSHIAMPLFLVLLLAYLCYMRKINWKQCLAMGIPLFILAVPLILFHVINRFDLPEFQLGIFTIPKLYRYRSDDMSLAGILENIKRFARFTLIYDGIKYNSIERFGTLYYISIPFLALGFVLNIADYVQACRRRIYSCKNIILFWFLAIFCTGVLLGTDGPIVYRMNSLYIAYFLFCIEGIVWLYKIVKKKWKQVGNVLLGIIIASYLVCFLFFAKYYFMDYTDDTYLLDWFNFKLEDPLEYLEGLPKKVSERITYIGDMNFTYIFFLGSTQIAPTEYNELVDDKPYTLWLWTESYGKYRFNFPEEIDPAGNYIVPETSQEYIQLYEEYGFEGTHVGKYYVFVNPWLDYNGVNSECLVSWDHGVDQDGKLTLDSGENTIVSGWALNSEYAKTWDDIVAEVDGTYYSAEKMDRQDVAEILGNMELSDCGFHLTLDTEKVKCSEVVRVIFINYKSKMCFVQEIPIK